MTMIPQVRQMLSPKSNNAVANQFIITTPEAVFFQSYRTVIAQIDRKTGQVTLDVTYWNYSRTTAKYRNIFLNENTAETRRKLKNCEYKLAYLNQLP